MKTIIYLSLLIPFFFNLTSTPVNTKYLNGDNDLRQFIDYWGFIQDPFGNWTIGRITHCDDPGKNCIIGPTIIAEPC